LKLTIKVLAAVALVMAPGAVPLSAEIIYWPLSGLELAKQRATSLACINNLRQIVQAARLWSFANGGGFPTRIELFRVGFSSPAVLLCPANLAHPAWTNWDGFDWGQIDYQWISQANWNNPADIVCKCRIHDNVALVDGSALWQRFGYQSGWPAIVAAPLGQYATPGSEVRFEVRIAPDAFVPVSYQWRREQLYYVTNVTFVANPDDPDGGYWKTNRQGNFAITLLSGQTNCSYVIPNAQTNHSDYYSVIVSNALGASASGECRLLVDPAAATKATDNYWSALNCANNLNQIGLLGRMSASDHEDHLPRSLSAMTNSYGQPVFGWPVALYCRFDTARTVPADWTAVDFANTSYEILPVDLPYDEAPQAPFCRCKVHGFYVQANGEVVWRPHFNGIRVLANDAAELSVTLFAGQTNLLEASNNLSQWTRLSPGVSTNGDLLFYETNRHAQRFYRIRTE